MTDRGYGRISLDNERSGSKNKQRTQIEKHANGEMAWYFDESVSGSKIPFAKRPEGKRLMDDLQKGDRVLVTKIDRAARNVRDLLGIVEEIERRGATIIFVEQGIDTSGPIGRFILVILAAIAELEANIIAERRRESLVSFNQEGRHAVGKMPYGFMTVPNPNGRGLVVRPHPEEGPLLRAAIGRVLNGESQAAVAASLGLKPVRFSVLLRNPRLAGMIPLGHNTADASVVMLESGLPRIDPETALLTLPEWERLKAHMKRDGRKPRSKQAGYAGALKCVGCAGRLVRSPDNRRPGTKGDTYKCARNANGHKPGTPGSAVSVEVADKYLEETFLERWGDLPYQTVRQVEDNALRVEALAVANIQLESAQSALENADGDEEEMEAFKSFQAAKRAVKAAESLPSGKRWEVVQTGMTAGDIWRDGDDATRTAMLRAAGVWTVTEGRRAKIEEKIVWSKPETSEAATLSKGDDAIAVHFTDAGLVEVTERLMS